MFTRRAYTIRIPKASTSKQQRKWKYSCSAFCAYCIKFTVLQAGGSPSSIGQVGSERRRGESGRSVEGVCKDGVWREGVVMKGKEGKQEWKDTCVSGKR